MKEYHKAIEMYDKGLEIEPNNVDCTRGKQKVMMAINTGSSQGGKDEEERLKHAFADPEVQMTLQDPRIQQVLKDMKEGNQKSAMEAMMKD